MHLSAKQTLSSGSDEIRRSNTFLDKYNEQLFEPHGLLCVVMTYKPDQKSSTVGVDMLNSGFERKGISSGTTHGELDMPEAAALVFPGDDAATAGNKSLGSLTAEYFDKRSQAKYVSVRARVRCGGPLLMLNQCDSPKRTPIRLSARAQDRSSTPVMVTRIILLTMVDSSHSPLAGLRISHRSERAEEASEVLIGETRKMTDAPTDVVIVNGSDHR